MKNNLSDWKIEISIVPKETLKTDVACIEMYIYQKCATIFVVKELLIPGVSK